MSRRPRKEAVLVNVYDLSPYNDALAPFGLGFFHTGVRLPRSGPLPPFCFYNSLAHTRTHPLFSANLQVEVHGVEYCYGGGGGIIHHRPRQPPAGAAPTAQQQQATPFRVQVRVGDVEATSSEVQRVVDSLRATWLGSEYHLLARNCNSFADELATRLCGRRIPGWINRLAGLGVMVSCLLPAHMQPPPASGGSAGPAGGTAGGAGSSAGVGRVLGGGSASGSGGHAVAGGGAQPPMSAEEARAKRAAAAERRQVAVAAAVAALPVPQRRALSTAAGDDEAETAPLSGRG
jgi:hypothetical protein